MFHNFGRSFLAHQNHVISFYAEYLVVENFFLKETFHFFLYDHQVPNTKTPGLGDMTFAMFVESSLLITHVSMCLVFLRNLKK